jgi:hypothetical protein
MHAVLPAHHSLARTNVVLIVLRSVRPSSAKAHPFRSSQASPCGTMQDADAETQLDVARFEMTLFLC